MIAPKSIDASSGDDAAIQLSPTKRALLALDAAEARLRAAEGAMREPIAIIGLGCRVPGADNPDEFWQLLRGGRDAIGPIPPGRFEIDSRFDLGAVIHEAGFIKEIDQFDSGFFGIAPREANGMDPQQRLLLEVSWEALENAGQAPDSLKTSATGVYVGLSSSDYAFLQLRTGDPGLLDAHYASGIAHSVASGRISYLLGLQGPSLTVDTACSSSLVAVHLACQALRAGECRMALAGGVNLMLSAESFVAFSQSRMLAPDGRCKTFDAAADGFARGEGAAVVVLKRLVDAQADGDRVLAVVLGSAVNQDGPSSGLTAPNGPAQEAVIRVALERAGVGPADISYIEAHGTGTALGDPLEVQALGNVFGPGRHRSQPLRVASVKTNLGHLEAAAGVTSLLKVVLALRYGKLPAHLHFRDPSPHIEWAELPIEIPTTLTDWKPIDGRRIAGISSFGFSGTNAHLIVTEAPQREIAAARPRRAYLFTLSARDKGALAQLAGRLVAALANYSDDDLAGICHTANVGRSHFIFRATVIVHTVAELAAALSALSRGEDVAGLRSGRVVKRDPLRLAFLFTGQGAQHAGMARDLYEKSSVFRAAFDRCVAIVAPLLPLPLTGIIFAEGSDANAIDGTRYTQPALFVVEYSLAVLLQSFGIMPDVLAGHSIGEFVAATVAGVFNLEDALRLVVKRGELMAGLPAGGAMFAIAAPEADVVAALVPHDKRIAIAAVNGPSQTVVSGDAAAVAAVCSLFIGRGIRCQSLPVSHAFHSSHMDPILDRFEQEVATVARAAPRLRLVSNVTGQAAVAADITRPDYWRRHLRSTVRFGDCLHTVLALRPDCVIEVGPQPTLLAFARMAWGEESPTLVPLLRKDRPDWDQLLDGVATLYLAGADINWRGLDDGHTPAVVDLPTYPFQRQRHWFASTSAPATIFRNGPQLHSLLGNRLPCATSATIYQALLAANAPSFINAHRVFDSVVLPATAYLEIFTAAARQVLHADAVTIGNVTIAEVMRFAEDGTPHRVQTVCEPMSDGSVMVTINSLGVDQSSDDKWKRHATAQVKVGNCEITAAPTLAQAREWCREAVDVGMLYESFARRGINFGPEFHVLRQVWCGQGQVVGEIVLDLGSAEDVGAYHTHPLLLDGCLQVLATIISGQCLEDIYLPIAIGEYSVYRPSGTRCFSHAVVGAAQGDDVRHATIRVFDSDGGVVADLRDVQFKRASRDALSHSGGRGLDDCFYESKWIEVPAVKPHVFHDLDPTIFARAAASRIDELSAASDIAGYDAFLPRFEAVCADSVVSTMFQLGWRPAGGELVNATALADQLRIAARHRRLFGRLLHILAETGWLAREPVGWRVSRAFVDPAPRPEFARLRAMCPPGAEAEVVLTERVVSEFASALRGEIEPTQLLFPGGSLDTAERIYRDGPVARVFGGLMAEVVASAAATAGRPLRILEVGAGTGGTTAHLLPQLAGEGIEYTFTDIGPTFVARARERFGAYPFMRFQVLDLERDDHIASLGDAGFDFVIAANVVHATADVRATLLRIHRLLRPGGVLAMIEVTGPLRWFDLTVGLTEGWWSFTDHDLRVDYATLTREQWLQLLPNCGFESVEALPAAGATGTMALQSLLLARACPPLSRHWLLFADKNDVAKEIAERLSSRGDSCTLVHAGAFKIEPQTALIDPTSPSDYELLIAGLNTSGRPIHGVVYAWSIDIEEEKPDAAKRGVISAMLLAKALLRDIKPPRLWILTRGGQYVNDGDRMLAPSQAPLWGLARSIAIEHPELACVAIDMESPRVEDSAAELDSVTTMLLAPGDEDQVALRGGRRLAARLARLRFARGAIAALPAPWRLGPSVSGVLDRFQRLPLSRRSPGAREVEIEVEASGLNFKDVLNALGLYPGDAGPLGGECAGRVTAVGAGVRHLRQGDAVMAVAGGSLASHVLARAELTQPLPSGVSMEDGASFPIAYLTAEVCLGHFARLKAGERVLIHAGAGGVGLAAVHLAQRAGAEIFVTVGAAWKRQLLRDMGVVHIFDSRSTGFASEILSQTGGRGVDVVLNSLSGDLLDESFRALARGGRFVEIGKRGIWSQETVAALDRDIKYFVVDWGEMAAQQPALIGGLFARLVDALRDGTLQPLPRQVFAFDDAEAAFALMRKARHFGKIVLRRSSVSPVTIRGDSSYLITGGLSGLGLAVAGMLAKQGAGCLVLVGRRLPAASIAAEIDAIRAGGTKVITEALDVSNEAALRNLLMRIRRDGLPLRGIVHSAGVLDDAALIQQDAERFNRVMAPKVDGAAALDQLTRLDRLDFFAMFSSIAAVLGSPGQANHAAANSFLDVLAHRRRMDGLPALSINWGAWSDIGAAAGVRVADRLANQGISAITPAQGLEALGRLLNHGAAQATVLSIDWSRYLSRARNGAPPAMLHDIISGSAAGPIGPIVNPSPGIDLRQLIADTPIDRRRSVMAGFVRERVARALGMAVKAVEPLAPLSELGLDSLLALELRNALSAALGQSLPATLLFDYPTVDALTEHLHLVLTQPGGAPASQGIEVPARNVARVIEELSDDEVDRLLASRQRRGGFS